MNARAAGTTTISENCEPTARASDSPNNTMRRQFHRTTSRGAYRVWATAMAVKMAPKAPQAAPTSGSANHRAQERTIPARNNKGPKLRIRRHCRRGASLRTTAKRRGAVQSPGKGPQPTSAGPECSPAVARPAAATAARPRSDTTSANGGHRNRGPRTRDGERDPFRFRSLPRPARTPCSHPYSTLRPDSSKVRSHAPAGSISTGLTVPWRTPFSTSQRHCARNASSRHAASTCGWPNRSRVKNRPMTNRRVFYHGGGRIEKLPRWTNQRWRNLKTACRANSRRFLPRLAHPAAAAGFEPAKLSPFEEWTQKMFIGRSGLRPIWRLVLYLLLYRGLRFCLYVLIAYGLPDVSRLWLQTAAELGLAIIVLLPALLMARIEDRPFGCYGLPLGNAFGRAFLDGRAVGDVLPHRADAGVAHGPRLLFRGRRPARRAPAEVCRVLGRVLPAGGLLRRILRPRLHPVHPDRIRGLLAGGDLLSLGFGALHLEIPARTGWAFWPPC